MLVSKLLLVPTLLVLVLGWVQELVLVLGWVLVCVVDSSVQLAVLVAAIEICLSSCETSTVCQSWMTHAQTILVATCHHHHHHY